MFKVVSAPCCIRKITSSETLNSKDFGGESGIRTHGAETAHLISSQAPSTNSAISPHTATTSVLESVTFLADFLLN